jgi:hypothetical protein
MDNLRDVERHDIDADMVRGETDHRRQDTHERQRHDADMTILGLNASDRDHGRAARGPKQLEQMAQPKVPASVQ